MSNTKNLNEILTEEQLREVMKIINLSNNDEAILEGLKQYFLSIKEQLEAKGLLSDYLAWAVYANCKNLL
ncbi:hypothetical protein CMI47_16525 [Candidatus Pacearchaeota archaeon]|jgi:hypothetical protein|nr:hypothetical protein [Candidatus Pacearchaeota archaeon]|tara:strand:- start:10458 stop:10667 length:210 start_codon:yes stop_codon:yes gene_type:complete